MIDLLLGALVYAAFMLAWWRDRPKAQTTLFVLDDELLHAIAQHTQRAEQVMRQFGHASAEATKALQRFQQAYLESVRRGVSR